MPNRVREYIYRAVRLWGAEISGPILGTLTIILGLVAYHWRDVAQVGPISAYGALVAAALMIFRAQYLVWLEERELRDMESRNKSRPDLRFIASGFLSRTFSQGHINGDHHFGVWFGCQLLITNHNQQATSLVAVEIDGSKLDPPVEFSSIQFNSRNIMTQGIRHIVDVKGCATVHRNDPYLTGSIDLANLIITIEDALGNKHRSGVENGELLDVVVGGVNRQ